MKIFTSSKKSRTYKSKKIGTTVEGEHDVHHRHGLIPGFDQAKIDTLSVNLIGAGGLGSEIGYSLVKKGVGRIYVYDDDVVTLTNLPRQYYFKSDLFKNKAHRLAKNLSKIGTNNTDITAHALSIQEAVELNMVPECDVAVVGVDCSDTRFFCSSYFYSKTPAIFVAVNAEADSGRVFVQEPGRACFGCLFADEYGRSQKKCVGSIIDINKVVAGFACYAVDSLIMGRKRNWNYRRIHQSGFMGDASLMAERDPECRFCNNI